MNSLMPLHHNHRGMNISSWWLILVRAWMIIYEARINKLQCGHPEHAPPQGLPHYIYPHSGNSLCCAGMNIFVDLVEVLSNPHSSVGGGGFEQGVTLLRLLYIANALRLGLVVQSVSQQPEFVLKLRRVPVLRGVLLTESRSHNRLASSCSSHGVVWGASLPSCRAGCDTTASQWPAEPLTWQQHQLELRQVVQAS